MKTEFMDQASISAYLKRQGLNPVEKADTTDLMISSKVIRCEAVDFLIAGMGGDKKKDDQIHLVVDAVHWHLKTRGEEGTLKLIFGKRENPDEQEQVENAVGTMLESLKIPLKVETQLDTEPYQFRSKTFDKTRNWMEALDKNIDIPETGKKLEAAINDEMFKWYRNVTGKYWSGRVGGIQVCKVDFKKVKNTLVLGKTGKSGDSETREFFNKILEKNNFKEGDFLESQIEVVASIIRELVESRKSDILNEKHREKLLESQVIAENLKIMTKDGTLESVCKENPFQFPTLWGETGKPRFVDVLMRLGNIPYVVELKESSSSSPGQYYRHGITQAVLYREFIRRAETLHPWFKDDKRKLDPSKCKSVLAFPEMVKDDKRQQMLLKQHKEAGKAFGVEVVEIEGFM